MVKKEIDKIVTPVFRVSFPQVFEAKAAPGSNSEKFSVVMLFPVKEDLSKLKALLKRSIARKYPDGNIPTDFVTPLKDGNTREYDGYKDTIYITASSQYQPGVLDEQKNTILNPKDFYAGCYAIATVNAFCWSYMGKTGVSVGLQNLMKMNDGEPLTGGATAEADFESIPLPEGAATEGGGPSVLEL